MLLHTNILSRTLTIVTFCFVSACAHQKVALNFQDAYIANIPPPRSLDFQTIQAGILSQCANEAMDQPGNPITSQQSLHCNPPICRT